MNLHPKNTEYQTLTLPRFSKTVYERIKQHLDSNLRDV